MAGYLTLIGTISVPIITGIFGYLIANHNSKSLLKQKMLDKDLEKKQQEEIYEEKLESLKLKHEQELKIIDLTHKHSLEKLETETRMRLAQTEGEAKIKKDSSQSEKVQGYTEQFFDGIMSSPNALTNLLAASTATKSGASNEEVIKILMGQGDKLPQKNPNNNRRSNSNGRRKNLKRR